MPPLFLRKDARCPAQTKKGSVLVKPNRDLIFTFVVNEPQIGSRDGVQCARSCVGVERYETLVG
jgi:hypothetical protein